MFFGATILLLGMLKETSFQLRNVLLVSRLIRKVSKICFLFLFCFVKCTTCSCIFICLRDSKFLKHHNVLPKGHTFTLYFQSLIYLVVNDIEDVIYHTFIRNLDCRF